MHGLTVLVSSILLIACANVSNLLLARALTRRRELAIRTALGSSRAAAVRTLGLEALLLAMGAGILGIGFAAIGVAVGDRALGRELAFWSRIEIDWRVLTFIGVLAAIAAVLAGIAPARRATAVDPGEALRSQSRSVGVRLGGVSRELVTVQIGLATFLLLITGLITRGVVESLKVLPATHPEQMAVFRIELLVERYPTPSDQAAVVERIGERLRMTAGVVAVAAGTNTPGFLPASVPFTIVGAPDPGGTPPVAFVSAITANFFATFGIPVTTGREFTAADRDGSSRVAIVTHRFAERYLSGRTTLGSRIEIAGPAAPFLPGKVPVHTVEVVGVVPDNEPLDEPSTADVTVYLPLAQAGDQRLAYGIRTSGDPAALVQSIGKAVLAVDPDIPVFQAALLTDYFAEGSRGKRLFGGMFGVFGLVGLLIASVGLFAVVAFAVRQRYDEIAVRTALGETGWSILWRVARPGLLRLSGGLGLGIGLAALLAPKLGPLLFGASPTDLSVLGGVSAAVLTVSLFAILIPAWRGLRIDPAAILRQQ